MQAQSNIISFILIIFILVGLGTYANQWIYNMLATLFASTGSTSFVLPVQTLLAYTEDGNTVLLVTNPNSEPVDVNEITVYIRKDGVLSEEYIPTSPDCGVNIPPNRQCLLVIPFSPKDDGYSVGVSGGTPVEISGKEASLPAVLFYGGVSLDNGEVLVPDPSGGYLYGGQAYSYGGFGDFLLLKLNDNMQVVWARTYGGVNREDLYAILVLPSSGIYLSGRTYSYGAGGYDAFVVATDMDGNVLWARAYGGLDAEYGEALLSLPIPYASLYLLSTTYSFGAGLADVLFVSIGLDGNVNFANVYGGARYDFVGGAKGSSSGFVVVGSTSSYGAGGYDILVMSFDAAGNLLWASAYGGAGNDYGRDVLILPDGYLVVASSASYTAAPDDVLLLRLDANGNVLWAKVYDTGNDDEGEAIIQLMSGNYAIAGTTYRAASFDAFVLEVTSDGNVVRSKAFGGDGGEYGKTVLEVSGATVLGGRSYNVGIGDYDFFLLAPGWENAQCQYVHDVSFSAQTVAVDQNVLSLTPLAVTVTETNVIPNTLSPSVDTASTCG